MSIKKSLIKQIRQTEKNDTPARVEYYGNPKAVTRMLVKLIEQGKLRYNGEDNYSRIIRTLTSVVDVVNESTGRIMSGESLVSYVIRFRDICKGSFSFFPEPAD